MSMSLRWLLLEALLPIFGAAMIFTLLGMAKWIVTPKPKRVNWAWKEALDSIGWLYGGAALAVQTALLGQGTSIYDEEPYVVVICFGSALVCGSVLAAAMFARGEDADWKPPPMMLAFTCVLMVLLISSAFRIHDSLFEKGVKHAL